MRDLQTDIASISLVSPKPERDAPLALSWFTSEYGKETLLLMGNAEDVITPATLESERKILEEFIDLERESKQLTWMIRDQQKTIGAVWVELIDTHDVKAPAVHIMIGDRDYRGRGVGRSVINRMVEYIKTDLDAANIYSRHLASNVAAKELLASCGFISDGEVYSDADDLTWRNVRRSL